MESFNRKLLNELLAREAFDGLLEAKASRAVAAAL